MEQHNIEELHDTIFRVNSSANSESSEIIDLKQISERTTIMNNFYKFKKKCKGMRKHSLYNSKLCSFLSQYWIGISNPLY
jgi:hypothetical protein